MLRALMIFTGAAILVGCAPFEAAERAPEPGNVPQDQRAAAKQVKVFAAGTQAPVGTAVLGTIDAQACRSLLANGSDSQADALQQLQLKALKMTANAVVNVTFNTGQKNGLSTECWETVTASGSAAVTPN
ncbi:MAG: heavy metal-binding domain-containing protein [Methylobacteriaceae bacterium]|nr:heavy metal-binding domain-containing protein [Methylobacteriaceae bacterium]MBV9247061.1 heavy metal-binding domain-containing protein [Methylobacteriaceae bacterium]MBV9704308.1 heavy metal-binding domain-containing protein [Methylobacteriaceae bacterium]